MPEGDRPKPPAGTVRISLDQNCRSAQIANVFWIRNGSGATPNSGDLQALLNWVGGQFDSRLMQHLSTDLKLTSGSAIYYEAGGEAFGTDVAFNGSGADPSDLTPANVAMVISWRVRARYRGGHPRTYLGGLGVDTQLDNVSFKDTFVNSVRVSADQFHADINAFTAGQLSDLHLGTVSFQLDNKWRAPAVFRDFTPAAALVDNRIDSQRRRLGPDR